MTERINDDFEMVERDFGGNELLREMNGKFLELIRNKEFIVMVMARIAGHTDFHNCDEQSQEILESIYETTLAEFEANQGFQTVGFNDLVNFFKNKGNKQLLDAYATPVNKVVAAKHSVVVLDQSHMPEDTRGLLVMLYHSFVPYSPTGAEVTVDPVTGQTPFELKYPFIETMHTNKKTSERITAPTSMIVEFLVPYLIRKSYESILNDELNELESSGNSGFRLGALKKLRRFLIFTAAGEGSASLIKGSENQEIMLALRDGIEFHQKIDKFLSIIQNLLAGELNPANIVGLSTSGMGVLAGRVINSAASTLASKLGGIGLEFVIQFGEGPGTFTGYLKRNTFNKES